MGKIIRLTENDLNRIVKKVIKEQREEMVAKTVEDVVDSPKMEYRFEEILSNLSERNIDRLKEMFYNLGIDENSSAEEIHSIISQQVSSEEMTEEDEPKSPKAKTAEILHNIGAGNIAAWGGVPAAIAIGAATGMPIGFAISWGVTGLLMGLAKVLGKK